MTAAPLIDALRALGHPIGGVYLSREAIAERVAELGAELAHTYADRNPLLVAPLKSSAVFLTDLSRALSVTHELDFVELAPYSGGEGGAVRLVKDLDASAEGRDLLLVEDVVDTGLTLNFLMQTLSLRQVSSLAAVTLLDRPYRRLVEVPLAHVGFTVPDELFAGYGLGLDERWRALPDLHVLETDELPATVTGDGFHHGEPDAAAA